MQKIAHIEGQIITNVSLVKDDWSPPGDGSKMLLQDALNAGYTFKTVEKPPVIVPFRALAFALLEAGLYEQVKASALSTPQGEIWWSTAQSTTVQRDHPFVAALATAVGQTPEQIDAIFAAAAAAQI
jgi:hypothetical protein